MRDSKVGTEVDIIKAVAIKKGYSEDIVADMYKAITLHIERLTWDPSITRVTLGRKLGTMYVKAVELSNLAYKDREAVAKTDKRREFGIVCAEKCRRLKAKGFVKTSFHFKTTTIESSFLRDRKTHEEVAKNQNEIFYKSINSKIG